MMLNFFQSIFEQLEVLIRTIGMLFGNLLMGITYFANAQTAIIPLLSFMPVVIGGAITTFIAIGIIRFLLLK